MSEITTHGDTSVLSKHVYKTITTHGDTSVLSVNMCMITVCKRVYEMITVCKRVYEMITVCKCVYKITTTHDMCKMM